MNPELLAETNLNRPPAAPAASAAVAAFILTSLLLLVCLLVFLDLNNFFKTCLRADKPVEVKVDSAGELDALIKSVYHEEKSLQRLQATSDGALELMERAEMRRKDTGCYYLLFIIFV